MSFPSLFRGSGPFHPASFRACPTESATTDGMIPGSPPVFFPSVFFSSADPRERAMILPGNRLNREAGVLADSLLVIPSCGGPTSRAPSGPGHVPVDHLLGGSSRQSLPLDEEVARHGWLFSPPPQPVNREKRADNRQIVETLNRCQSMGWRFVTTKRWRHRPWLTRLAAVFATLRSVFAGAAPGRNSRPPTGFSRICDGRPCRTIPRALE